jgi:hypothetical protein
MIEAAGANLRKAAERTVGGLWDAIGRIVDTYTPAESTNYFAAAGYLQQPLRPMAMAAVPQIVAHFIARKKHRNYKYLKGWSEWQDSNLRPLRPEPSYRAA